MYKNKIWLEFNVIPGHTLILQSIMYKNEAWLEFKVIPGLLWKPTN